MRRVGLDLGARHIAFCEVADGRVVHRTSVRRFGELEALLGPKTGPAQVAFEASREGWHVHDALAGWGKQPVMLDTTRVRQIGVGQHGRKNDALDAEAIARALDAGRVPAAHVLSPARRVLRAKLSVRGELVEMRGRQVTLLRGLARAAGILIASSSTDHFLEKLQEAPLDPGTRALMAPLVATLTVAQEQLAAASPQERSMLKPTATTVRSPQRARKKKKTPSPRLTEAPVQSQAAKPPEEKRGGNRRDGPLGHHPAMKTVRLGARISLGESFSRSDR